jgi:Preprotein translocase subunit YidC
MYHNFVYQPILNTLLWLYGVLGNNLGLAIIVLTLLVRFILIPFTPPPNALSQAHRRFKARA